jgi:4-hydroxybutyrate CoA-transferase
MYHMSAHDAVSVIKSGNNVFIHSVVGAPQQLIEAMTLRAPELRNVNIIHLHTEGDAPYAQPGMEDSFHVTSLFIGANVRKAVEEGRADYVPIFLSEMPNLFKRGIMPLDVALITVSPPDRHGFCSLGTSVDVSRHAVLHAKYVIAQINRYMPRTHGEGLIHISKIHTAIEHDQPLYEVAPAPLSHIEQTIGRFVSELVEDGATLQMGIGAIPDAALAALTNHKGLGIHTEMFSDGVIPLVEKGVITGEFKARHPNKITATFLMGSRALYDFVDDNPMIMMLNAGYVNDTAIIRQNPKVTAINSAVEIDMTGQVCADSIGTRMYSGVGGQMDFIRGASLSDGGKPIIALPSTTTRGESRIVPYLKQGAGVVTTRAHVHYIATEYGVANLYGKHLRERAKALINIAHPDHREALEKSAYERFKVL